MGARGIETIVAGVDGSEQSAEALGWAVRMALLVPHHEDGE